MTPTVANRWVLFLLLVGVSFIAKGDLTDHIDEPPKAEPSSAKVNGAAPESGSRPEAPIDVKSDRDPNDAKPASLGKKRKPAPNIAAKQLPVTFESAGLAGLREKGFVELKKDVFIEQGDLKLRADSAKLYFDLATDDVKKVVADGNVQLDSIDPDTGSKVSASGQVVEFDAAGRTVVLRGNAQIYKGKDLIKGDHITYDLKTGWIKAEKVRGVVKPEKRPNQQASPEKADRPDKADKSDKPEKR